MENDWTISTKETDDAQLQQDGTVRLITRVRFWIGKHGPFDRIFDRDVDESTINAAITTKRDELQRRASL